ncbi:MAG: CPBP family intramembrane metalloprotease [Rubrivivax sp.]|nr:CPBP family intramembrane metalloprotease [Pyrinomonadaceae bacterium]
MDTPQTSLPQNSYANFTPPPQQQQSVVTPDNPPWGILGALGIWILSFVLMLAIQLVFLVGYIIYRGVGLSELAVFITKDPSALFFAVLSIIPAHLLTLGFAWLLVTKIGKHPFLPTLGWDWTREFTFWRCAGLAVGLLLLGLGIIKLTGNPQTELDRLIESSRATALATAFLATVTAPFVEEVIYRGILYSPLQRAIGKNWAVAAVVLLFAAIHVPQYWPSFGVIGMILLLSFVLTAIRARTGSLLPCFIIHLIFNGIQSVLIVLSPYIEQPAPVTPPVPSVLLPFIELLARTCW